VRNLTAVLQLVYQGLSTACAAGLAEAGAAGGAPPADDDVIDAEFTPNE